MRGARIVVSGCLLAVASSAAVAGVELDLAYVPQGTERQKLDLYTPDARGFATIVYVHEGSLQTGDRKDEPYAAIARTFQGQGVGCALISYRLQGDAAWPAPARDTASAFAWVKRNVGARGGDAARIYFVGHSSGSQLVSLLSTDPRYLREVGLELKDVAGTVAMGSLLEDPLHVREHPPEKVAQAFARNPELQFWGTPEAFVAAWPMPHVGRSMPPLLVLVAEAEQEQPPILADAKKLVAKAREVGAWAAYEVLPDRTHMSAMQRMTSPDDPTLRRIVSFVADPRGGGGERR